MIILRTKTKIALARTAQRVVMGGRKMIGRRPVVVCRRGGLRWQLDLREGIDFSIFLLGGFERKMTAAYRRMIEVGAIVIDIGANIGAHTLPIATRVGPTGRVVAVEPTRYAFERLRMHIGLNPTLAARILPLQTMLMGSRTAVLAESVVSSWPLDTPSGAHPGHAGVAKATTGAVVRTLDDLVSELDLRSVDFVKLDVEGSEPAVLAGVSHPVRHLSFEFLPRALDQVEACLTRLHALGIYRFNWSAGESYRLASSRWLNEHELLAALRDPSAQRRPGDVDAQLAARHQSE